MKIRLSFARWSVRADSKRIAWRVYWRGHLWTPFVQIRDRYL